ncbi:MAG: hypothetical protein AAF950_14565 [Pseudomonadota bacterium]
MERTKGDIALSKLAKMKRRKAEAEFLSCSDSLRAIDDEAGRLRRRIQEIQSTASDITNRVSLDYSRMVSSLEKEYSLLAEQRRILDIECRKLRENLQRSIVAEETLDK